MWGWLKCNLDYILDDVNKWYRINVQQRMLEYIVHCFMKL